jgi:hypothetical protein
VRFKVFDGLPAYPGGKRSLAPGIFRRLPPPEEAPRLVDAFCGACAISVYAKLRGYEVTSIDCADRAVTVARALVDNSSVRLDDADLLAIAARDDRSGYAQQHLADLYPEAYCRFFDRALALARERHDAKASLLTLLVIRMVLILRAHANFGAKALMAKVAGGEWEQIPDPYAVRVTRNGVARHPMVIARQQMARINRSVFSNGRTHRAIKGNVLDVLPRLEGGILVADPPYPSVSGYEREFGPLDRLLAGGPVPIEKNPFTALPPEKSLPPLLEAARNFETIALCYGNRAISLGDLVSLVKKHRPKVEGFARSYKHIAALASRESQAGNQELLVVASRR